MVDEVADIMVLTTLCEDRDLRLKVVNIHLIFQSHHLARMLPSRPHTCAQMDFGHTTTANGFFFEVPVLQLYGPELGLWIHHLPCCAGAAQGHCTVTKAPPRHRGWQNKWPTKSWVHFGNKFAFRQ